MSASQSSRIEQIVNEIRSSVRERSRSSQSLNAPQRAYRSQLQRFVEQLHAMDDLILASIEHIGDCPPQPPSIRGRIGALLIRLLSKVFWWYKYTLGQTLNLLVERGKTQTAALSASHEAALEALRSTDRISAQFDVLQTEFNDSRAAATTLRSDLLDRMDALERKLHESNATGQESLRREQRAEFSRVTAQNEVLLGQLRGLSGRLEKVEGRTQELFDRMAGATADREELAHSTAEFRNLLDNWEKDSKEARTSTAERIAALENQVAEGLGAAASRYEEAARLSHSVLRHLSNSVDSRLTDLSETIKQLRDDLTSLSADFSTRLAEEKQVLESLRLNCDSQLERIDGRVNQALESLPERDSQIADALEDKLSSMLRPLEESLSQTALAVSQHRSELLLEHHRITRFIKELRQGLPIPTREVPADSLLRLPDRDIDAMYVAFEDVFRGSRGDIRERQSYYLPLLQHRGIGTKEMPVVDLGCGRGEWLELLRDHGMQARGSELNLVMIEKCKELNLDVLESDALDFLSSQSDSSLGAVTCFHVIEHLPFEKTLMLIDEALRVLKSGGLLLLETPNPGNLAVGASTFYLDPTHVRPLPSALMQFVVEARGFVDVEIRELHPYPAAVRLPCSDNPVALRFNECFYGPQDYSVIGWKP